MSLDVSLMLPGARNSVNECIFIRADGQNKELTRAEWEARSPDRDPVTVVDGGTDEVYAANITHNLNRMADAAGIYQTLWRPEEIGITHALELIVPLQSGLALLRSDPERFKQLNPENGWGTYEGLVEFVERYLVACENYPAAAVSVSR